METKNEPNNDDLLDERGREIVGLCQELLLEQLHKLKNTKQCALTLIETLSQAGTFGLSAMDPEDGDS